MGPYSICSDVTFTIQAGGVLASNHRARSHIWLSLPLFNYLAGGQNGEALEAADLSVFSNVDNLMADPTCLNHQWDGKDKEEFATVEAACAYLGKHFILISNEATYKEYFGKKQSILDQKKMGSFHQRLGYQLFLERRLSDETQCSNDNKVDNETGEINGALYKYVQDPFLDKYFSAMDWQGKVVLDFGCGNGMANRHLARLGAEIIGIDPDKKRLAKAHEWFGESFSPIWMDLTAPDPLVVLPEREFDFVWMADVFLFYFYPLDAGEPVARPAELLKRLTRNLKPGGKCAFMDPHGCFWLAPWLGQEEMPFTVLTEYSRRMYNVTPSLEELADAISEAGLHISRIYEPKPVEECRSVDPQAYSFASNFPQWWVFELVKPG